MVSSTHTPTNPQPPDQQPFTNDTLKARMGEDRWRKRRLIEEQMNPSSGWTFRRLFNIWSHCVFKSLLWIILGIMGKRTFAHANCWKTSLKTLPIEIPNYSGKSPLRILHLSDLHLDTNYEQAATWISMVKSLEYDITVITGDFFNHLESPTVHGFRTLKTIIDSLDGPIFGILGNHDRLSSVPAIEAMGVNLLINESYTTNIGDTKVTIIGIDDPHLFKCDNLEGAVAKATAFTSSDFRLLLAHAPEAPERYARHGFDLCLCGHTHGGQLCLKNRTPLLRNGPYQKDTISGSWKSDSMNGYTSKGTGTGRLTYRLNCPPEIVLHTIR